jgi:hypothetical protein
MFKNHLRRHIIEISKNVQLIKSKLREEEHSYQHIRKILQNLEDVPTTPPNLPPPTEIITITSPQSVLDIPSDSPSTNIVVIAMD